MLLILFALSIGFATFVENDFGTIAAKAGIYNAKWFEFVLLLLAVNMTGSVFKHKMYLKPKWTILLFHVSFLIIFIGAAVTRYIGYEGIMSIREGNVSNEIRSDKAYIKIWVQDELAEAYSEHEVFATPSKVAGYKEKLSTGSNNVSVEVLDYFANAGETYVNRDGGEPVMWLVLSEKQSGRQNMYLKTGQSKQFGGYIFGFESDDTTPGVSFKLEGEQLYIVATDSVSHMNMMTNTTQMVSPDSLYKIDPMNLYKIGGVNIVLKQFYPEAVVELVSTDGKDGMNTMDAFTAEIRVDDVVRIVNVYGGKGYLGAPTETDLGDLKVSISYGSKLIKLPFSIRLDDFQLERYPGSNSPSSYASDVTVMDQEENLEMPYRIYMNNVLNYRGFRFFQSSYDRDELGTVLSVNHDGAGTIITYLGYFLMSIGMFLTIFNKNSRFRMLTRLSKKLRDSRKTVSIIIIGMIVLLTGNSNVYGQSAFSRAEVPVISKEHADKFGRLLVQDKDGRIKPMNTVSSEVLRKIARKNTFNELTPEQVFLGILVFSEQWQEEPFIKVAHDQLKDFLEVDGKYATFNQIVDTKSTGTYRIGTYVENAYAKKPAEQSKFDKEVMKVDERVNIFYMVYSGAFLNTFPIPDDVNNKWVTSAKSAEFSDEEESLFVKGIFPMYFSEVEKAVVSGDWSLADEHLGYIMKFQERYGPVDLVSTI